MSAASWMHSSLRHPSLNASPLLETRMSKSCTEEYGSSAMVFHCTELSVLRSTIFR